MADEIQALFTGTWIHIQDDHLPPFFDAVGALEEEKQYLLNCQPQIQFEVKGETITITYTQNPTSQPDVKADVSFKLGEEFEFQPEGHLLQVKVEWKDKKVIQHLTPIQSHSAPHIVEFFIDKNKDLVQVYKVTEQNGKEVTGTRKYQRK